MSEKGKASEVQQTRISGNDISYEDEKRKQDETINQRALLNLFQAIIANNRAGGWRKLKGSQ